MKYPIAAACAVFAFAIATAALAENVVSVTLEAPVKAPVKVIAAHSVFACEGVTCTAAASSEDADGWDACQDLARKVGRVAAYKVNKPLDEKSLAKCNKGLAPKAP